MTFNSLEFVFLFLPLVVAAHGLALGRSNGAAKGILLLASLAFYALSSAATLPILAVSFALNAFVVRRIQRHEPGAARRRWLVFGLVADVGALAVFKYSAFVLENVAAASGRTAPHVAFALPLGLSFFTIQQIMYLVDCYEGLITPAPLLDHAVAMSFFPTISAGPITSARDFYPQLDDRGRVRADAGARGLLLFAIGLVKKVVLAQAFQTLVEWAYKDVRALGPLEAWLTSIGYTFQIYFDFSGYTDMALGIGLMLGLSLPPNFNSPLQATSIIDFWNRWHITLTKFITTYLYTPMARAGGRLTFRKAMAISLLSMTIAGLWHGPAWTYVAFGFMHGVGIVINHVWRKAKRKLPRWLAWGLTFAYVNAAFVLFRARDLGEGFHVLGTMIGLHHGAGAFAAAGGLRRLAVVVPITVFSLALVWFKSSNELAETFKPSRRWAVACAVAFVVCALLMNTSGMKGFVYRDF